MDQKKAAMMKRAYLATPYSRCEEQAGEELKVVIGWGRYAELFAYDVNQRMLSLDNPE